MSTPSEIIRATCTEDVEENIDYVRKALIDMMYMSRGTVDYEEQISITLPNMLSQEEIYPFIYGVRQMGWSEVRVVEQHIVTFYFPPVNQNGI